LPLGEFPLRWSPRCSATSRCCSLRWHLILAHELWEMIGEKSNLLKAPWPQYDAALAAEDEIEIPVQVNGKLRSLVVVTAAASEEQIKQAALADEKVRAAIAAKQVIKVIIVPKKLVNIVAK
jgi:leucyl-tRNA synthetase